MARLELGAAEGSSRGRLDREASSAVESAVKNMASGGYVCLSLELCACACHLHINPRLLQVGDGGRRVRSGSRLR
jgi:hypothetical protein